MIASGSPVEQVGMILAQLLDMASAVLPPDDFSVSMVVRCKMPGLPAHMVIGLDEPQVVIATLEAIIHLGKTPAAFDGSISVMGTEPDDAPLGEIVRNVQIHDHTQGDDK